MGEVHGILVWVVVRNNNNNNNNNKRLMMFPVSKMTKEGGKIEAPNSQFQVDIQGPDGGKVNVERLQDTADGFGIVFGPEKSGAHTITVTYNGANVKGSPFRVGC